MVSVPAHRLSLVAVSEGYPLSWRTSFLLVSLVAEHWL